MSESAGIGGGTARASETDIGVPEGVKVDTAFMCSLYHIIYTTFTEQQRQQFLDSIKHCLKPDGTLSVTKIVKQR